MARIELSNIGGGGTTLSLTTTGTSGASTLVGSVLNIPIYQGQLTLTTTGTSGAATLVGDTLNIPNYATGGNPAGSAGQVQFNSTPAGSFAASANLAWDNTAVQLNINAPASPTGKLNVKGSGATSSTVNTRLTDSGNTELLKVLDNGSTNIGTNFNWDNVNGRLGLGTSTPNQTLEVSGAMRLTGTAGTAAFMLGRNSAGDVSTVTLTTTGTGGAATLSGNALNIPIYSGGASPGGATGEIQYNNAGAFGASANLAWDNTNVRLNVGAPSTPTARFNVRGGGTTSSTVNLRLTNSGNTELASVLDNGQVNFSTNLTTIDPSTEGLTIVSQGTSGSRGLTISQHNNGINGPLARTRKSRGTLSSPTNVLSGDFVGGFEFSGYIGGAYSGDRSIFGAAMTSTTGMSQYFCTGTTNGNYTPTLLVAENGNVGVGSIGGTIITSLTLPSAKLQVRGSNASGGTNAFLVQNSTPSDIYKIENDGKISYLATNTAAGTTGAQTINRPSGTVNFAAGATALVVTNSLCTTASLVFAEVRTNDATAQIKNVVPAAGSFTINLSAAATAETSVGFFIIN